MSKYSIWELYEEGEGFAYADSILGLSNQHKGKLLIGEEFEDPFPRPYINNLLKGKIGDVIGNALSALILCSNIVDLLPKEGVQILPATCYKALKNSYNLVNILNKKDCFDREKSKFTTYKEDREMLSGLKLLVIDEKKLKGIPIIRLGEFSNTILVHDSLREKIHGVSDSPGIFTAIKDYNF